MYVPLTTHSAFSLLEGLALPAELASAAEQARLPALGLTDHRLLTGAVEFVLACRRAGVQPVLGLEVDLASGPVALFAMSLEGWGSLCALSSTLALGDPPEADCTLEQLGAASHGLLAVAGVAGQPPRELLGRLKEIFPGRLYLSLPDPAASLPRQDLGRRMDLPLVVTQPVYCLSAEQVELQRTISAIRTGRPLSQLDEVQVRSRRTQFTRAVEIERRFQGFRSALAASAEIAERCRFDLPIGVAHMPVVPLPPGLSAAQVLRQKAEQGAARLYGRVTPEIRSRLEHELAVISGMGFEPIFLIVEEILDFAREQGIPFSSRGSAASSLVAHCLGITSPDPLGLDLYFERFLNPARSTPPDIDTDLCSRRRDEVITHVTATYGAERVAMVGTINHFRPRSALGEVAKAHGMSVEQARALTEQLPYAFFARLEEAEEPAGALPPSPFEELRAAHPSTAYRLIFNEAQALLRLPRHLSVHAGGLIVAPGVLTDLVPVMRSGSKGVTITQFDLGAVEALGLVKIDLLGIRGLTVLGDVAEFIQASHPERYAGRLEVLESTPADDPPTSARLESGGTIGCFQIESPGMRTTLREIRARSEHDLMAALALYRPGPLSGGLKEAFVRRFKGEEPIRHLHPTLAPLLEETYGVILYQEQVLRIAHELAGFSLAEADLLRRAMSHFDPGRQMQQLESKFVRMAAERSGIPAETAERVWEMMAAFSGYGFPKAHAASYARVAWRSAWCKTHFPAEFMAAVLANWGGYYSQRVYLSEARRLGLSVRPPHVNASGRNFSVGRQGAAGPALFMGLDQVRELSGRTIERIIARRPYAGLEDFLARADPRPQEALNLARVGALEGFGTIPALLQRLERGGWQPGQPGLFAWGEPGPLPDWTLAEKGAAQTELLGVSLDAHPLELLAGRIAAAGAVSTVEAAGRIGQRLTVAGVRQSGHRSRTAKGETMMFLTLEDLAGMLDVVLFPDAYRLSQQALHSSAALLVTGVVESDPSRAEPLLRVEKVVPLEGPDGLPS